MNEYYIYVYLDIRKPGIWRFGELIFEYQPFYIGKGKGNRINHHLRSSQLAQLNIKSKIINKIINETGDFPIFQKIYENLSENEAFEKEIQLIDYFGRINLGTGILANMTGGGPGVPKVILKKRNKGDPPRRYSRSNIQRVDQFDLNGNWIKKYESFPSLSRELKLTEKDRVKIKGNLYNMSKSALGFIWKFDGTTAYEPPENIVKNKRKVSQFSISGKFIKTHESLKEAGRSVNCLGSQIWKCGQNINFTCKGFRWRYGEDTSDLPPIVLQDEDYVHPLSNKVYQYSEEGFFVNYFPDVRKASRELNIKVSSLKTCSSGKRDSINGFQFFYEDQGERVEPLIIDTSMKKGINVYNKNKELIRSFNTLKEASKFEGIPVDTLRIYVKYKREVNDVFYKYFPVPKVTTASTKSVYQYSIEGKFLAKYSNPKEMQERTGFDRKAILFCCRSGRTAYKFQWFHEDQGPEVPPVIRKERKDRFRYK